LILGLREQSCFGLPLILVHMFEIEPRPRRWVARAKVPPLRSSDLTDVPFRLISQQMCQIS
jgi:hypothetical protein